MQLAAFSLLDLIVDRLADGVKPYAPGLLALLPSVWQQAEGQSLLRIQARTTFVSIGGQQVGSLGFAQLNISAPEPISSTGDIPAAAVLTKLPLQALPHKQVLVALQRLVHALGAECPAAYPLVLPVLKLCTDPHQPDELNLLEDGLQLW